LISGDAQICEVSHFAALSAIAGGADLAIVGNLATLPYSFMVPAGIRFPSDLKEKAIAISSAGSAAEASTRLALTTLGLLPDRDVTLVTIGRQGDRMAAMKAGYVSGTLLTPPATILAKKEGFQSLLDMSTMRLPDAGTVVSRTFLQSNRATVLRYMKAIAESIFLIKSHRQDVLPVMSKVYQLDPSKDDAVLNETYEALKDNLLDIPYPSAAGVEEILEGMSKENSRAIHFKAEQIVDLSIVRELEEDGFFRDLRGH
jgi:ABC-type nitrate/sulfonate/bicarbonate transport system substrate-binding protein